MRRTFAVLVLAVPLLALGVPAAHAQSASCSASPDPVSLSADPGVTITVTGLPPLSDVRFEVKNASTDIVNGGTADSNGTVSEFVATGPGTELSPGIWKVSVWAGEHKEGPAAAECSFTVVP